MPVVVVVGLLALALGLVNVPTGESRDSAAGNAPAVTVAALPRDPAIPSGFLGLSLEYSAVKAYAGPDARELNPVFEQLVENLTPGQSPVLRIGGDSADGTWYPVPGMTRPPGVTYTLDGGWLEVTRALTQRLGARLILDLNLEADSPTLTAAEATALSDAIGPRSVLAVELGNEPELYGSFPWYRRPDGKKVTGRPRGYGFDAFMSDFSTFSGALSGFPIAGPAAGGPGWTARLGQFLAAAPQVKLMTLHRYPLQLCFISSHSDRYPTVANLLSSNASTGLADRFVPTVALAHSHGMALRIDEFNTVSCGAIPSVSRTFASALWALDTLFELARVGVDGVNVHTFPGAGYELFSFDHTDGRWHGSVAPEYYGLLMFAQATPPGSRLLGVSGQGAGELKTWATRTPDGATRTVLINKDPTGTRTVALRVPQTAPTATLERLQAPSVNASSGTTLGGQRIGLQSTTGTLEGKPDLTSLSPTDGKYVVTVPPGSAALLTVPAGAG